MPILNEHFLHAGILPLPAMRLPSAAIAALLCSVSMSAQSTPAAPQNSSADYAMALHDYESCTFQDGLQIVKVDSLPPGVQQREIETTHGPKIIHMLAGRRIMFAYGVGGDFFANVKPEVLPAATWDTDKQNLLDEIAQLLASQPGTVRNTNLTDTLHGLEVHGIDHAELKGGTLGFYLLLDNERRIATSMYFLNQQPLTRRFQTVEEYRNLRTRFLAGYTGCIAQNQALRSPAAKDGP
jgi:hypothetical protein